MSRMSGLRASRIYNPPSILDGDAHNITISVPGAKIGDFVFPASEVNLEQLQQTGYVSVDGTVAVVTSNSTGSAVDLASHTLRVKVVPAGDI